MPETAGTARKRVLGDIRQSLTQLDDSVKQAVNAEYDRVRSSEAPRPVVDGILVDKFIEKHTAVKGSVKIVSSFAEVPAAVSEFLNEHDLPNDMVMGKSDFLSQFDWPQDWKISKRTAQKTDVISVTDAICVIAETGTIVIASSPKVSSTHLFLPENHIVILNFGQVVRHLEDALKISSPQIESESRGFHMITGPSKTADVEQTIQYGAHGPKRLHIVMINAG